MTKKILIAYGTRYGATPEAAAVIAKILEKEFNFKVEIYTLKKGRKMPDITEFDHVIIGSGISQGKWVSYAEEFLDNDFDDKKVAVFVSSGLAGTKTHYDEARKTYLEDVINKHNLKPVTMEAFGGRIPLRMIPKIHYLRILQRLPEFQRDNRDWNKIEEWARTVGKLFSE